MTLAQTDRKRLRMKFAPQRYPVDSIPQPETVIGGINVSDWDLTASRKSIVRSPIAAGKPPELALDFEAIQREARAARSAWVASRLKSYYEALVHKLRAESNFTVATSVLKGVKNKAA
jgi:hypothetical protein